MERMKLSLPWEITPYSTQLPSHAPLAGSVREEPGRSIAQRYQAPKVNPAIRTRKAAMANSASVQACIAAIGRSQRAGMQGGKQQGIPVHFLHFCNAG